MTEFSFFGRSIHLLLFHVFYPQDDYFVTSDQTWIPLRWIAPELVDEVHGNLLVVDQTKEATSGQYLKKKLRSKFLQM